MCVNDNRTINLASRDGLSPCETMSEQHCGSCQQQIQGCKCGVLNKSGCQSVGGHTGSNAGLSGCRQVDCRGLALK